MSGKRKRPADQRRRARRAGMAATATRRVLIANAAGDLAMERRDYSVAAANQFQPIVRLTDAGPHFGEWPNDGDEVGYGMRVAKWDDCFAVCVATVTQVDIGQVPNLDIARRIAAGEDPERVSEESWERMDRWAERRALRLTVHEDVPVDRRRWVAVCADPANVSAGNPHCLVASYARVIWDPSITCRHPDGLRPHQFGADAVAYGLSLDNLNEQEH
jgi:hypothetical protein